MKTLLETYGGERAPSFTPSSVPPTPAHSPGNVFAEDSVTFDAYEQLGKDLSTAMTNYSQGLRTRNFPPPSLQPAKSQHVSPDEQILAQRTKVVELAKQIIATTADPAMSLLVDSLQFHFCSCLKIAVDLRVGDFIPAEGTISASELAKLVGSDESLLVRVMRVLMTRHIFAQPSPGHYGHTSISWTIQATPHMSDLLCHRLKESFRSASREPDALRLNGYREPKSTDVTGFNLAFNADGTFWDHIWSTASHSSQFQRAMKVVPVNSVVEVPSLYPFSELANDGGVIVDVGGGAGQLSEEILRQHPEKGLRCIVQDQHTASDTAYEHQATSSIEFMAHDFFSPQPVKGAAAYLFRHIFHDWPDDSCIQIIRSTVPAMDQDHSRILIVDQLMKHSKPAASSVLYDMDMMTLFGGKERTLTEVIDLINRADGRLSICSVKQSSSSLSTIIEVRL